METLSRHMKNDIRLIGTFVEVYCRGRHGTKERATVQLPGGLKSVNLCPDCAEFMQYAVARRIKCPLEAEKPTCKHCRVHCYAPKQRALVREIMGYSGRRMILRGRLDYLWHYFF